MDKNFPLENAKIAVIGLGYVGLPLALALARHFPVVGFDQDQARIRELEAGSDRNHEVGQDELRATTCRLSAAEDSMDGCNLFIVTVPTPVADDNSPDLSCVEDASRTVGRHLKKRGVVVYESTVYPGVTEDVCGPVLEKISGLKAGKDFWLGYSPERINPGDTAHTVHTITKVVSGQTPEVADYLAEVYGKANGGNVFKARDIKTAEASKVIENAQRDINVAFINEVAQVMGKLGLNMYDVLDAASTKWNFLPFRPGLVGGHCIGVDPYYLADCAQKLGHNPEVILAGRRINDGMGRYFARVLCERMERPVGKILIMGFTFKENINDIRNTKVMDVYEGLREAGHEVDVHDPHAHQGAVRHHYGLELIPRLPQDKSYDAVVLAVAHESYASMGPAALEAILKPGGLVYDLKGVWRKLEGQSRFGYMTV